MTIAKRVKAYAGIGSTETPDDVCMKMMNIASVLGGMGWTLRSGGADQADTAFEMGCDQVNGAKEIFLPWHQFNKKEGKVLKQTNQLYELAGYYYEMRPDRSDWVSVRDTVKLMMMRNVNQVLGEDLHTPSQAVICWTLNGSVVGGTAMALTIAMDKSIPIFNLALPDTMDRMEKFFGEYDDQVPW